MVAFVLGKLIKAREISIEFLSLLLYTETVLKFKVYLSDKECLIMENAKNLEQLSHQLYNLVVSDKLNVVEYSPDKVHHFRFFLVPTIVNRFKALVC